MPSYGIVTKRMNLIRKKIAARSHGKLNLNRLSFSSEASVDTSFLTAHYPGIIGNIIKNPFRGYIFPKPIEIAFTTTYPACLTIHPDETNIN